MITKTPDELSPLEQLGLVELSYSRFDSFDKCEAQYYYSYLLLEPRGGGNKYSLLGNVIHSALELKLPFTSESELDDLVSEFHHQIVEWDEEEQITHDLVNNGEVMLTNFWDTHRDEDVKILHKEMSFEIVVGQAYLRGAIDRVDEKPDGTIAIIDYKSGSREVAKKHIPNNLQLGIYALAAKKAYPDRQIYAELYYLKSERRKGHLFTDEDLERVRHDVVNRTDVLLGKRTFKTTQNSNLCNWCDHAKSGACPVGEKRLGYR